MLLQRKKLRNRLMGRWNLKFLKLISSSSRNIHPVHTRASLAVGWELQTLGRVGKAHFRLRSKARFPFLLPIISTHLLRLLQNVVTVTGGKRVKHYLISCGQVRSKGLIYIYSSAMCFSLKPFIGFCSLTFNLLDLQPPFR